MPMSSVLFLRNSKKAQMIAGFSASVSSAYLSVHFAGVLVLEGQPPNDRSTACRAARILTTLANPVCFAVDATNLRELFQSWVAWDGGRICEVLIMAQVAVRIH